MDFSFGKVNKKAVSVIEEERTLKVFIPTWIEEKRVSSWIEKVCSLGDRPYIKDGFCFEIKKDKDLKTDLYFYYYYVLE